jgi:O-antigen/teichoic acid export membrane protein
MAATGSDRTQLDADLKSRLPRQGVVVESVWVVSGQAAAVIGSLIGLRLLTEMLDPATYGELALGLTLALIANQTLFGPLANGAMRFFSTALEMNDVTAYVTALRTIASRMTAFIIAVTMLLLLLLHVLGQIRWVGLLLAVSAFSVLAGYNGILNGMQNAARQRGLVAIHQGLDTWLRFFVAITFMIWFGADSAVAMGGFAAATLMVLTSQCLFFRHVYAKYNE